MIPNRISMVTYNLWNTQRWLAREPALREYLSVFKPDILCLQEIRNETLQCICESLDTHAYIKDALPGWTRESNIFWNKDYFTELAHGLEELEMPEQDRGLFWVRLKLKGQAKTIFIATAHFTWQGHHEETETGLTARNRQARQTLAYLRKLVNRDEAAFFMGDLNDPVIPHLFFPEAGYESCFKDLNLLCPSTYPALPTTSDIRENQTIDWVFSNGKAKTIAAFVPQFYFDGIAPSDHWPIHAIYQL
jgi:endonuclease/exonuclease/phosphatase family metal-dependent hydrolase